MKKKIQELIFSSINELNEILEDDKKISLSEKTILLDPSGGLDSLSFFNFILSLEKKINGEFHKNIILTDLDQIDYNDNPFKNVQKMTNHIEKLIKN
tara:strand:- start:20913 stop:21203 length:291 start_codon:yes stop_codon:yes gene_type:complete